MAWENMFRMIGDKPSSILIMLGFIAMAFVGIPLYFVNKGLFILIEFVGLCCLCFGIYLAFYES